MAHAHFGSVQQLPGIDREEQLGSVLARCNRVRQMAFAGAPPEPLSAGSVSPTKLQAVLVTESKRSALRVEQWLLTALHPLLPDLIRHCPHKLQVHKSSPCCSSTIPVLLVLAVGGAATVCAVQQSLLRACHAQLPACRCVCDGFRSAAASAGQASPQLTPSCVALPSTGAAGRQWSSPGA